MEGVGESDLHHIPGEEEAGGPRRNDTFFFSNLGKRGNGIPLLEQTNPKALGTPEESGRAQFQKPKSAVSENY